ncbi:MAG: Holliday junction resolvase RuvX [Nitrospirae bacterium]|nr:Holliday junction resolvase RuvX [Nitrospirota bacterium]
MRYMGLDVGEKTIGVAVSDGLGLTAQGLDTIRRASFAKDFAALAAYIAEYEVGTIVVGLPKSMDGSIGTQAEKVLAFVEKMKSVIDLPVVMWDERLTTAMAQRALIEGDVSRKDRRKVIDRLAAQLILQGYMDRVRGGGA